jgi:predicted transposase/invertase (TIGR01784 family)
MFDNICKFLVENFSKDFANWLMRKEIAFTRLEPSELSLEPIRADAIILLESEKEIMHLEFQTLPKKNIPFRMTDYRLRGYRRSPEKEMRQFVIYLQKTESELAKETCFILSSTYHEYNVIRMWEQPTETFLQYPGLLPFAVLSNTTSPTQVLQQVVSEINKIADPVEQSNVVASTAILAGLILDQELIYRVLRSDIMQESVIYQDIQSRAREEGLAQGVAQGVAQGLAQGVEQVALNLLQEGMDIDFIVRTTGLTTEKIQELQRSQKSNS